MKIDYYRKQIIEIIKDMEITEVTFRTDTEDELKAINITCRPKLIPPHLDTNTKHVDDLF